MHIRSLHIVEHWPNCHSKYCWSEVKRASVWGFVSPVAPMLI